MRLQGIKLNGFKSFGEKTYIEFDNNLIGIVGPNGSGKSNIIDAIKWVFGEQKNKAMRTTSNTDVIFVGSENKKGMNFAEVTLIFDNKDYYLPIEYSEVAITRKLYKTGENEYYINKKKCRLKDINNLILDKGFGKDSFSIISQGKVEQIIMAKPEQRREVVEEVAGILKYKNKKNIANRKLEKTKENIEKIQFIINQINKNLEPLKIASDKAKQYKIIKEDLTKKEINLLSFEIINYKEKLEQINLNQAEKEIEYNQITIDNEELQNKKNNIEQKITTEQININKKNNKIIEIKEQLLKIKNEEQLNQEKIKMFSQNNKLEERFDDLNNKINLMNQIINKSKKEEAIINPQIEKINQEINELQIEQNNLKTTFFKEQRQLNQYEEQIKNFTYPYAINQLLEQKKELIIDLVDRLYKSKKEEALAIDIALGSRKNEVVTQSDEEAKICVNWLKETKKGRATFIPLNKIKPRYIKDEDIKTIKNSNNINGCALDFIEYDKKYTKVFAQLLGTTIICPNVKSAYNALKELKGNYQIVTLTGEIVNNTGKLTGGSYKQINRLYNEQKIEEIKILLKEIKIKEERNNNVLQNKLIEKTDIYMQQNIIQKTINENTLKLKEYENELKQIQSKIMDKDQISDSNVIQNKIKDLTIQEDLLNQELEKNKANIQNLIESNNKLDDEHKEKIALEKTISQQLNDSKIEKVQIENKISIRIDKLREEYELGYQKALSEIDYNIDLDEEKEIIKKQKEKIKKLGFVNIEAIEQYNEEKEKSDYYEEQLADLLKSYQGIEEVISKLDKFVITQFKDAYEKLNIEFSKIFIQLFGGGNAQLILTDPNNLLETGVEIIAQPPGKKSQVIGLLSGGEKSLTAIALLFAILKIRIIPYAILDEVEAALDEANVNRYASYLQVFSQKTQFIIVTHRQGTMEKLNKLYGVTMPNKGISSVLEVDLTNIEI